MRELGNIIKIKTKDKEYILSVISNDINEIKKAIMQWYDNFFAIPIEDWMNAKNIHTEILVAEDAKYINADYIIDIERLVSVYDSTGKCL